MQNVILSIAENKRSALTQSPFGEFAVLGLLLVGTQIGLSGLNSTDHAPNGLSVSQVQNSIDSHRIDSAATLSEESNTMRSSQLAVTQLDAAQLDYMIDQINTSRLESTREQATQSSLTINQQDSGKPNHFGSQRNNANSRFVFKQPAQLTATVTTPKQTRTNASKSDADQQFVFTPPISVALGRNAKADLFAVSTLPAATLAVWDINNQFSLASKKITKSAATKQRKTNDKFVIMIDPGHGGTDPGSIGHNGLKEKILTLDIAKRAQRFLSEFDDISVQLTRDGDNGMSRKNRVRKVKQSNADMVVSLHLNHLPQADVNLVETFYAAPHNIRESLEKQRVEASTNGLMKMANAHNYDLSFTQGSRQLATLMQKRVFEEVIHNNPNTDNAGVKQDTLYILTRSFTPGVLIEMSCLSNIQEAERLADPAYRDKLAAALADGIRDYLNTPEAKRQFGTGV